MTALDRRFCVAPMMDWTDRHCRYFHRLLSRRSVLFTEMVVAEAVIHGPRDKLLGFDPFEKPLILQIGGSQPERLAEAVRIAEAYDYDGYDLNVGCPSDRVQSGRFGACLMREPDLVARCVAAMRSATDKPVSVKTRIGVDDGDPAVMLPRLAHGVVEAGADALTVHARKAWLKGLSPKENRDVPPLEYHRVHALKDEMPATAIILNGGLESVDHGRAAARGLEGMMLGRAAYKRPGLLRDVDGQIYGDDRPALPLHDVVAAMADYSEAHRISGGALHHVTRHMAGLAHGLTGAAAYRRALSQRCARRDARPEDLLAAWDLVDAAPAAQEAA
jgi:tRNA-dihydrouridine synthase A